MKKLAIDGQFRSEHVIYLHHVFAKVENIAQRRYESEWISSGDQIRLRQFGEDILDVRCGDRINRAGWDTRAISSAATGHPIIVCPLRAHHVIELSVSHPGIKCCGCRRI